MTSPTIKKKSKKEKCFHCKKNLKLIHFTCRCNHKFCIHHQLPHNHNCPYDSRKDKKEEIKKNNPKLNTKIQKI